MPNEKKLAVLIDGDNAPASRAAALFAEVAKYGLASVKRVYGDWSSPTLNSWQKILLKHALVPVQQFAYTKNKDATDMGLVIEAMDLLYSAKFDGFCLVSSDSDFTPLASRIRAQGLAVYGFGEKKTPEAFRNACDKFIYVENLETLAARRWPPRLVRKKLARSPQDANPSKGRSRPCCTRPSRMWRLKAAGHPWRELAAI